MARITKILFPNSGKQAIEDGIFQGSLKITSVLCSNDALMYGECNSDKFEVTLIGADDITGMYIKVVVIEDEVETPVFYGKVESATIQNNGVYRNIVAYDDMYYKRNLDVSEWYNSLYTTENTTYTVKQLRDSLCAFAGITQEKEELINDNFIVKKTMKPETLSLGDMLKALAQINATFCHFNREGVMEWVKLSTNSIDVTENYKTNSPFEQWVTESVSGVKVINENNETSITVGTQSNTYVIDANVLLYGNSDTELTDCITNFYNEIKNVSYTPCTLELIVSDLSIKLGSKISFGDKVCYNLNSTISGSQLYNQQFDCSGVRNRDNILDTVSDSIVKLENTVTRMGIVVANQLNAYDAKIENLEANALTVDKADVRYADIHLADIDMADIGMFYAQSGLLKDVLIIDGHITGVLDAVKINADVITSGTLAVDRLLITGKDSLVYQINAESSGLSIEELSKEKYQKYLNGTDIVANSITANEIAAGAITANEIAAGTITANEIAAAGIKAKNIDTIDLFAQDITATGTISGANMVGGIFESTARGFINPGYEEYDLIRKYVLGTGTLTYAQKVVSDFNQDGVVSMEDTYMCRKLIEGDLTIADVTSEYGYTQKESLVQVTINPSLPEKAIRITGRNAWNRTIDYYFGTDGINTNKLVSDAITGGFIRTSAGVDLDELNSNVLKHSRIATFSTVSVWSPAISLGSRTIFEILVLDSSNKVVTSQIVSCAVAENATSGYPLKINSGTKTVAQLYVGGSNNLYLFNYQGYKTRVYA